MKRPLIPVAPPMNRIPAGEFWMGSNAGHTLRHRVFTDAFEIALTPVTRAQYALFLGATDSEEPRDWRQAAFSDPAQPVVGVSWFDAVQYCGWLSEATRDRFRLPTEAEWEKACRGGADDRMYAWGDEEPETLEYFGGEWPGPRPVALGPVNGYGLFNMGDNVHEWCRDWFSPGYYDHSPSRNPEGPEIGTRRVSRGGSWRHAVKATRAAARSSLPPGYRYTDYGFRVAR